jgi:O-antigen ligase
VLQSVGWDFLTWGTLPFDTNRAFSTFGNPDLLAGYVALMMPIALVSFVAQDSDPQDEILAIGLALIIAAAAVLGLLGLYFKWSPSLMRLVQVILGLVSVVGLLLPYLMRFIDVLSDRQPREGHFVSLYAVASLLIGIATVTAFARSAWVAGGVSLVAIGVMLWRHKFLANRKTITLALVIVLAVGSIAVATSREESGVKNLGARVQSIFQFGEGSAKSRFSIWRSALAATKARPLTGFGPDTFRLVFPRFKEAEYTQQVGRLSVADNVHNYPLQLAATLGIPGSLLFYAVMFSGIYWGWRAAWGKGERSSERTMMGGLVIGLISYQTHLFFGISITGSTFLFWVIMAMALLPWVKSTTVQWREASTTIRTAGFGAVAAVAAVLFIMNIRYFQADQFYLRSYQYATVNVDEAINQARTASALNPTNDMYIGQIGLLQSQKARSTMLRADGEAAIADIQKAIAFNPWEYDNYIFLANAYAILGDTDPRYWEDVVEAGAQALRVEPVAPAARFYRGLAYLSMKQYEKAKKELEVGHLQDPSYGEVNFTLGQVYEAMGDKKNALKYYELSKTTLPVPQQAQEAIQRLAATSTPTT